MAALIESFVTARPKAALTGDWMQAWGLNALPGFLQTTMTQEAERNDGTFESLVYGAYLRNSIVFSCLALRARLFSEARFVYQQLRGGLPGNLFGTPGLSILEQPNPDMRTRVMLSQVRLHADIGGHGFVAVDGGQADVLRPDWTVMAYGSRSRGSELGAWDPQARIAGFGYYPGGEMSGEKPITYLREQVAHVAGAHHPLARNRGVSLLAAPLREVMADNAATTHKLAFFEHAATPNLALKFPPTMSKEAALEWIELFEEEHKGALNAFRTLYLGAGVEPFPVGLNFQEMDFTKLQGEAETRIAAATGMHPVVAALSEGLAGSSLNAGNFAQAARLVGDATLRPLWGEMADAFSIIAPAPAGSRLWYDDRQVAFLRSDVTDQADIIQKNATSITTFVKEGFTPESSVDAVVSGDMTRLVHSGMVSVQLQPPGTEAAPPAAYRVRGDFWAIDDPWARYGTQSSGQVVSAGHPLLAAYPAMFEPVIATAPVREAPKPGPARIVSIDEVLGTRDELEAAGLPCGYDSIAARLHVSRDTVRRRLAEHEQREAQRPLADALGAVALATGAVAAAVADRPEPAAPVITVPVTVEPARVERGAVQVSVTPAPVTVHQPSITVPVTVEPARAPDVQVVNGDVQGMDPAELAAALGDELDKRRKPTTRTVERDEAGLIVRITEDSTNG
jgi:hypothetical protein